LEDDIQFAEITAAKKELGNAVRESTYFDE